MICKRRGSAAPKFALFALSILPSTRISGFLLQEKPNAPQEHGCYCSLVTRIYFNSATNPKKSFTGKNVHIKRQCNTNTMWTANAVWGERMLYTKCLPQRCRTLKFNTQLVGGTTVQPGAFSYAVDGNYNLYLDGTGITCTWARRSESLGGGGADPSVFCLPFGS